MARVLVTGANGQMGCNLVRQLRADGHEAIGMVREGADLTGLQGLELELRKGDVRNAGAVAAAVEGIEVVVNLAAVYDLRARDPEDVIRPAVEGVRNVLAAARQHGVGRVIHVSSFVAVGASEDPSVVRTEEDWAEPVNCYHRAKTASERAAWATAEELGVPLVVLCPTVVLGRFDYRITPSTWWIKQLVDGPGMTGNGGFNLVDVRDVAVAVSRSIERGQPGERYIVGGENVMQKQVGALVGELTGRKPTHLPVPRFMAVATVTLMAALERMLGKEPVVTPGEAAVHVGYYLFGDTSKANQAFDLTPRGARDVLEETIRWLVFTKRLRPKVLARLAERFPPDPGW